MHVDEIYFSLPTLLQIYAQAHHGKCVKIDVWSLFQSCEKEIKKKFQSITLNKIEISFQPQGWGGVFGAWGQLGAACMMQYLDDSLNFSGYNSHRLSFDIEFRDTSPLTLLLVVNAMLLS